MGEGASPVGVQIAPKAGAKTEISDGLARVMTTLPIKHGYAELGAGFDKQDGLFGRAEAGYKFDPNLGAFGYAQADTIEGFTAGAGVRWTF